MHFSNTFQHGKETFPKGSPENEIFSLLEVFHLPYSKYTSVKIYFQPCRYQNQKISLVSLVSYSCRTQVARVSSVSFVSRACHILVARVALVSFVSGTRVVNQTRSYDCDKLSLQYAIHNVNCKRISVLNKVNKITPFYCFKKRNKFFVGENLKSLFLRREKRYKELLETHHFDVIFSGFLYCIKPYLTFLYQVFVYLEAALVRVNLTREFCLSIFLRYWCANIFQEYLRKKCRKKLFQVYCTCKLYILYILYMLLQFSINPKGSSKNRFYVLKHTFS